jgi:hypothetical protein
MSMTDYSRYLSPAHPGMFHGLGDPRIDAYVNRNSPLNDIWEVAIVAPVVNTVYEVIVDGCKATYKAVTGETQATLGLNLYKSIVQNPLVYRTAQFTYDPTAHSITIESREAKDLVVTSNLTATQTQNAGVLPPPIPFGRAVASKSTYNSKEVTLPTAASDVIKGVAISTHWIERIGVPAGLAAYRPLDSVNVCDRTNNLKGVYVQCVEADIVEADPVYVAVSSPNQGKFTKTATGNIAVLTAAFRSGTITTPEGGNMILLQIDL